MTFLDEHYDPIMFLIKTSLVLSYQKHKNKLIVVNKKSNKLYQVIVNFIQFETLKITMSLMTLFT